MSKRNKHGLSRHIPENVKRKVREKSKFGCVICRKFPYHYDHFKTPFHDAIEHDPDDIVLLCHEHHLAGKTAGVIDVDVIEKYMQDNPVDESDVTYPAPLLTEKYSIEWPSIRIKSLDNNIIIDGEEVLRLEKTGDPKNPIALSGKFFDDEGNKICCVENNEFTSFSNDIGDLLWRKNTLTIKSKSGETVLECTFLPKVFKIEKLRMIKNRCYVIADQEKFLVGNGNAYGFYTNSHIAGCLTAISLNSSSAPLIIFDKKIVLPRSYMNMTESRISVGQTGILFS